MYLHVGQDHLVPYRSIIAIFDIAVLESAPETRFMLSALRAADAVIDVADEDGKSLILTDDRVYISPVSSITLRDRVRRPVWTESADAPGML